MVDGPLKFNETVEGEMNIVPISLHGRDFSIVKVPYAFKLLYQELLSMNVQMRIITEDNIDELTTISKSDNILKLTGYDSLLQVSKANKVNLNKFNENITFKQDYQNINESKDE